MKQYKINEIFCSIQGEGFHTGRAAIFIRFSGCNLSCPFCDTKHQEGQWYTVEDILAQIREFSAKFVVLTGGEPTLQVDDCLIDDLTVEGYEVAIETNGTALPPLNICWVTFSPKDMFCTNASPVLRYCDEIKVVFTGKEFRTYENVNAKHRYIQPCDTGDLEKNAAIMQQAVEFIKQNPQWKLSLQTQKILNVR